MDIPSSDIIPPYPEDEAFTLIPVRPHNTGEQINPLDPDLDTKQIVSFSQQYYIATNNLRLHGYFSGEYGEQMILFINNRLRAH